MIQMFFWYMYQVSAGYSVFIQMVSNKYNISCGVYMLDNNTKYSFAKRGVVEVENLRRIPGPKSLDLSTYQ